MMNYKTGVYKIQNLINGRFYIGGTIKGFQARWIEHKTTLNRGKHRNRLLQEDWIKYGEKTFEFIIMESLPVEEVLRREQEFLKVHFDGGEKCYNLSNMAIAGGGIKNGKRSLENTHDKPEAVKNRQSKRRAILNGIARAAGYTSWTVYETAVINKATSINSIRR